MEVQKASFVQKQQVSCVEIDVPSFQHVPQQLLLRLGLVPSIAQKLAESHQWSHQYPCFSCGHNRHDNFGFTLRRFLVLSSCTSLQHPLGSKLAERGNAEGFTLQGRGWVYLSELGGIVQQRSGLAHMFEDQT